MKGRKGMELRGTKIALVAVLTCLLSLTAWLGVSQLTARADDVAVASANAVYNSSDDSITVYTDGTQRKGYNFFTLANASKTIPSSNQWIKTDGTVGGKVNLSGKTGAAIYYFANSTSPTYSEIVAVEVPAVPTIAKVKYSATAESGQKLIVTTKYSYFSQKDWKQKTKKNTADLTKIQYKVGNGGEYTKTVLTGDVKTFENELPALQKAGSTVYVRVTPKLENASANATAVGEKPNKVNIENIISFSSADENTVSYLRAGAEKAVKIAKAKVGPAVTIDYANHSFALKRGTAAFEQADAVAEASGNAMLYESNKKIYDATPGRSDYYTVAKYDGTKATSSYTHVELGEDKSFASSDAKAVISGAYETDATLKITRTNKTEKESYQYALSANKLTSGDAFLYADSVTGDKKVSWKTITMNKQVGDKSVSIKWSTIVKNNNQKIFYVYVRKAAVPKKGIYSSQVVEFKVPTKATEGWTMKDQVGGVETTIPYIRVTYAGNMTFNLFYDSRWTYATDEYLKIGNNELKENGASNDVSGDASANAQVGNNSLTQKAKLAAKIVVPEGMISFNGIENATYTIPLTINTLMPVCDSAVAGAGKVTFKFKANLDRTMVKSINVTTLASGNAATSAETRTVNNGYDVSGKNITYNAASGTEIQLNEIVYGNDYGSNVIKISDKKAKAD